MISFNSEHRKAAGVLGGKEVDVTLELDLEPRNVGTPLARGGVSDMWTVRLLHS